MSSDEKPAGRREPAFWGLVTAGHGRHYEVTDSSGRLFRAHPRGRKSDAAVGDTVGCCTPEGDVTAIEAIAPRKNLICRSDERRNKAIAANVDLVAVLFAPRPAFNPRFVWRAAIAARAAGCEILAIRTKSDLEDENCSPDMASIFSTSLFGTGVLPVSISATTNPAGALSVLQPHFSGKTVLLVGQSGMGKSTLLNLLCPAAAARTQEFSEALNSGKQTTTTTRLYSTVIGGRESRLIDSPGFQAFGLAHVSLPEILLAMPDIARHATGCRYYNCTHTGEPECSVRTAVEKGEIGAGRYAFYCELARERS